MTQLKLERLLQEMLDERPPRPRRLPGGLGLRYTPPRPGDLPQLHVLSLSRRDHIDPSTRELQTVHKYLARVRPAATKAMFTRASQGDMMIRRITWNENVRARTDETETEEESNMPELSPTSETGPANG